MTLKLKVTFLGPVSEIFFISLLKKPACEAALAVDVAIITSLLISIGFFATLDNRNNILL